MDTTKAYVKPQITRIELKPEDAVLTACKITNGSGSGAKHCVVAKKCVVSAKGS